MLRKTTCGMIVGLFVLGLLTIGAQPVKGDGLKWDLNGDGVIDLKDLAEAGLACYSVQGSARWNNKADVNDDLKIDIKDIAIMAKHFGERVIHFEVPELWMGPALGLAACFGALGVFRVSKWKHR